MSIGQRDCVWKTPKGQSKYNTRKHKAKITQKKNFEKN